ncbi:3D domain-containing protein [Scatolibacter rhodanostii]|uniref:3D domain-containing protein n=1 Tax=Scatolibacter rhodanostii TaxID=2014781 RepID=UPI000C084578|nr:3D domain-containing protein [Scatolibacter rhodanostii]
MRKERKLGFSRRMIAKVTVTLVMSVIVCAASFATALANTVSTIVTDGDQMYTFSMESTDLDEIIKKAEEMGLAPLGVNDICERVGNTTAVNVRRGANITVNEAGSVSELVAFKGDTVEKALADNSIILKNNDKVTPAKETIIRSDMQIAIERYCSVTIFADGKEYPVSLVGATVKDAIEKAGLKIGTDDDVNYSMDKPLFNNMRIRVGRIMTVKISADGETKEYKVFADNVENAIEKAGLKLGKDDVVTPLKNQKLTDNMEIVIKRVEIKEETKTEEIAFQTVEETDSSIYAENGFVKTEGVNGKKELTVKQYYVEGELDREESVSEKIVLEPVNKVVVVGTKKYEEKAPVQEIPDQSSSSSGESSGSTTSGKTFTGYASAYSNTGYTADGSYTSRGIVAVDPSIIPYGTRIRIDTANGYSGEYIAADTGGALQSGRILVDIWMPTSEECLNFGIQNATVTILD